MFGCGHPTIRIGESATDDGNNNACFTRNRWASIE